MTEAIMIVVFLVGMIVGFAVCVIVGGDEP